MKYRGILFVECASFARLLPLVVGLTVVRFYLRHLVYIKSRGLFVLMLIQKRSMLEMLRSIQPPALDT